MALFGCFGLIYRGGQLGPSKLYASHALAVTHWEQQKTVAAANKAPKAKKKPNLKPDDNPPGEPAPKPAKPNPKPQAKQAPQPQPQAAPEPAT